MTALDMRLATHLELPRRWWLPPVWYTHPGYALVLFAEAVGHLGLGIDGVAADHLTPIWRLFGGDTGVHLLGLTHLAIFSVMLIGCYRWWRWVRWAFVASVSMYLLQVGLFATGWIQGISHSNWNFAFRDAAYSLVLGVMSAAGAREPVIPGNYAEPDRLR